MKGVFNISNIKMYTPIKIKKKENLKNIKNFIIKANTPYLYSNYLKNNNKNIIKSNNKFLKTDINKEKNINDNKIKIKALLNKNMDFLNKRKSFPIRNHINNNNQLNCIITNNRYRINNNLKEKRSFTYNFIKDTQRVHYSTIILRKKNKNKNILNKTNYDLTYFSNLYNKTQKSNNTKSFNENKKIKNYITKKILNNNYLRPKQNLIKYESNEKNNESRYNKNSIYENSLKLKNKLIDSPDSLFYYIYNYINDKKNKDNLEKNIFYSKIDMKKKFKYYKKDLEKLEEGTNFEIYYLKRQVIPEKETKLFIK